MADAPAAPQVNVLGYSDAYNRHRASEELKLSRKDLQAIHDLLIPVSERIGSAALDNEIDKHGDLLEKTIKRRIEWLYGSFTFNGSCSYYSDERFQLLQVLKRLEGCQMALSKYNGSVYVHADLSNEIVP
jgi:hypothetical protein